MIEVFVESVRIEPETQQRFVMLQDINQLPRLSILVAHAEAYAIAIALSDYPQDKRPPRPLTHDLLKNMLDGLGAKPVRVVVTKVVNEIFYAEILLETAGEQHMYDARPSDAFALAVRTQTPIFVEEAVIEQVQAAGIH